LTQTQTLTTQVLALDGTNLTPSIDALHDTAKGICSNEFPDWGRKSEDEREAITWVRMLEWSSNMEDRVFQIRGAILKHIQDHDLLRYHPGRSNWGTFLDMVADRVKSRVLSPSESCDLAFVSADVVPAVERLGLLGELAPSLSVVRTLVPAIRIAMKRQDDVGLTDILVRGSQLTLDQAQGLATAPERLIHGTATATSSTSPLDCRVSLSREQFARLRRQVFWIEWEFSRI
jgi:hypothetical protein